MTIVEIYRQQLKYANKTAAKLLVDFYAEFFGVKVSQRLYNEMGKLCKIYAPLDVFEGLLGMAAMDNISHGKPMYALMRHFVDKAISQRKASYSENLTEKAEALGERLEYIKENNARKRENGTIPTRVRDSRPVNSAKRPK